MVAEWTFSGLGEPGDAARISSLIARILLPNFFFNKESTEARSKASMETVRPVLFKVQKGEMIVRIGERISCRTGPETAHDLPGTAQRQPAVHRDWGPLP